MTSDAEEKLMYYQAVESIKITYAQPLQKAAERNATGMVKILLKLGQPLVTGDVCSYV